MFTVPTDLGSALALDQVLSRLPHRPPHSLLDRVLSCDRVTRRLLALRQLTAGDAAWPVLDGSRALSPSSGHFSSLLLIEALSQAAACFNVLAFGSQDGSPVSHRGYLVSASALRFPACAQIGDTVYLFVEQAERLGHVVAFQCAAYGAAPTHFNLPQPPASHDLPIDAGGASLSARPPVPDPLALHIFPALNSLPDARTSRPAQLITLCSGRLLFAVAST